MSKYIKMASKYKIDYLFLALVMGIFYGKIQWNNFIGDPDGFYHAKIAEFINQGQLIKTLPWMQFSNLRDSFTDHQLLYHLILVPFTNIVDPLIGAKVATVFLSVVMILVFYWLLKRLKIDYPLAFAFGFLLLNGLNFRLTLIKANSLSLMIIWLIIYALLEKKYWLLLVLNFAFVWSYGMWPISLLILFTYLVANKIHNHIHINKIKIFWNKIIHSFSFSKKVILSGQSKMLFSVLGGLTLGVLVNPYWPQNINFYKDLFKIGIINYGQKFTVGSEWYGTNIGSIISSAPHLFVFISIVFIILFFNYKKVSKITWFSFFLALGFLIMTAKSRRYVEYYMPFALLFAATGFQDVKSFINKKNISKAWHSLSKSLKVYMLTILAVFLILVMPSVYDKILGIKLSGNYDRNHFKAATDWLKYNTPEKSIVFHSDWDEWPILFYQNDQNYYIIGLDPTLMEQYDSALHTLYREINLGNIQTKITSRIKDNFKANYVLIEKEGHEEFIKNLNMDSNSQVVYQDHINIIYQLN